MEEVRNGNYTLHLWCIFATIWLNFFFLADQRWFFSRWFTQILFGIICMNITLRCRKWEMRKYHNPYTARNSSVNHQISKSINHRLIPISNPHPPTSSHIHILSYSQLWCFVNKIGRIPYMSFLHNINICITVNYLYVCEVKIHRFGNQIA